ncbi:MAG: thioredoxin domain-containing protein [Candidatus Omnitrophica bacterium]|nr:thioredoxin domain-containing protein [Candidatus Omnitrophota bacterium]
MENKNDVIAILLVVLIAVIAMVGIQVSVKNGVQVALSPVKQQLDGIGKQERNILNQLNGIHRELNQMRNKVNSMGNGVPRFQPQPQLPPPEDMNKVYNIPVGDSAVLGNKNAPVTITEFSDFQCPFCARFYPVIKQVLAAYPDKVRVVIKNFPLAFHPNALPAAKLAMAANEQGKFQGMMESLLANGGDVSDAKIKEYAQNLGLNYNKLMADYKNQDARWTKQIDDDLKLGADVDVRGTPTFYLDGRKTNARDLESFKAQIDPILANKNK